jgi:hypothetical protein
VQRREPGPRPEGARHAAPGPRVHGSQSTLDHTPNTVRWVYYPRKEMHMHYITYHPDQADQLATEYPATAEEIRAAIKALPDGCKHLIRKACEVGSEGIGSPAEAAELIAAGYSARVAQGPDLRKERDQARADACQARAALRALQIDRTRIASALGFLSSASTDYLLEEIATRAREREILRVQVNNACAETAKLREGIAALRDRLGSL